LAVDWWDESSHGLLIPPVVFYIAWLRRSALLSVPATPDFRGIVFLSFGCLLLLIGELAGEFFISRLSLVVVIVSILWTFWGRARIRVLALPLLLLLTMIPVPLLVYNSLALPLQILSSGVATKVAQLAGVSAFQEGNVIHLAQVSLGVAEACSGLRSLGSLVVMGLLVGFIQCRRLSSRLALVFMAIPIAIALNVLRVSGTAILADYNYRLSMGFYHTFSGWLIFLAGMALIFAAAKIVHRLE
jgi:exosortase